MSDVNIHDRWKDQSASIKQVIVSSEKYIVFIDHDIDIDWETTDEFDQEIESHKTDINKIKNLISLSECQPLEHHYEKIRLNYKRMLGEAFVRMLELDFDKAIEMIEIAKEYISQRNLEISRLWILTSSFHILIIYGILCIAISIISFNRLISLSTFTTEILLSFVVGGIGAIVSLILRLGNTHFDYNSGQKAHLYECIAKVVIGSFAGVLIYTLVRIKFILPFINDYSATGTLYMLFLSFIVGSSERFIPSILSTYKIHDKEKQ